jgi:hypothetical protein
MQAQLAERGVTATSLADVAMLRVPDVSEGTWDLACVPHRHHDDQLWWAWLRHGRGAGAPAELDYICPSGDPRAAERVVRVIRGAEAGRR